jgi:2-polyprenyl-3-methyl-5-hydroxy-6-metoxy-1,4-benzoquinol methylase
MISEEYRRLNKKLHEDNPDYGNQDYSLPVVQAAIEMFHPLSVLDYGCGKGKLVDSLRKKYPALKVRGFDPAVPAFNVKPLPMDLVTCTDVLEHVEPEYIDAVLQDIRNLARVGVVLVVACRPAKKTLPDGSNAHRIVETPMWWYKKLRPLFGRLKFYSASDIAFTSIFSAGGK